MKIKVLATLMLVIGLFAGQSQAEQSGAPDGEWSGNITLQCTVHDTAHDLNFRHPHIDVQCSSGRCFAQLSFELYEKDTGKVVEIPIPGWENPPTRLTIIGWGPIVGRHVENGIVQSSDNHEQQDIEAYLDGLTVVFLPNDDLSINIDHDRLKCSGIKLPKL